MSMQSVLLKRSQRRIGRLGWRDSMKKNKPLQIFILGVFWILQLLYVASLVWESSAHAAIVMHNTEMLNTDMALEEVSHYEVDTDGKVYLELADGSTKTGLDAEFVFVDMQDEYYDEVYYSPHDNKVICQLASNYWWNYLGENNYWVVFIVSLLMLIVLILITNRNWVVLSQLWVKIIAIVNYMLVLSGGIFVYIIL